MQNEILISVFAAVIPTTLFLIGILYFTVGPGRKVKPKVIPIKEAFHVIGVQMKTSEETFYEDDLILWKEYRHAKEKGLISSVKGDSSFVAIKSRIDSSGKFEYLIGDITQDPNLSVVGLKNITVPAGNYAAFKVDIKDDRSWVNSIRKIEKYVYAKWLPKSEFMLNDESEIRELEYFDKKSEKLAHSMIFYLAVKKRV